MTPPIGPRGPAVLRAFTPVDTPGTPKENAATTPQPFTLPPRTAEVPRTASLQTGLKGSGGGVSTLRPAGTERADEPARSTPSAALRRNLFIGEWAQREVSANLQSFNQFHSFSEGLASVVNAPGGLLARAELFTSAIGAKLGIGPDMSQYQAPPSVAHPGPMYTVGRYIATLAREHGSGNCGEKSMTAAVLLADRGLHPVEVMALADSDHGFCVVGRDPNSDPADPTTWGPNAVVVDPWYNETYPATEMGAHMQNGGTMPRTEALYSIAL